MSKVKELTVGQLREAGYCVVVFNPDELSLGATTPGELEGSLVTIGESILSVNTKRYSSSEEGC